MNPFFTVPSSNPTSTFLPENYTSNGQSLPSHPISSKFAQKDLPSDTANDQPLPSQVISSKFAQRGQPSDTANDQPLPSQVISSKFAQRDQPSDTAINPSENANDQPLLSLVISSKFAQRYQPSDTANDQPLPSQVISSKFTQRGQPSDAANTSSSGGFPPLTPLPPQISSTAFIPPSSSRLPLTGSQANHDGTRTLVPQAATEPSRQRSPSPQGANAGYLRHEDSSGHISPAEDDVVELPPFYTPV